MCSGAGSNPGPFALCQRSDVARLLPRQLIQRRVERLEPALADPLRIAPFDLALDCVPLLDEGNAARRQPDDAAARVLGIDATFDGSLLHQLVDELLHRLLAHAQQPGEIGLWP